MWAGHNASDSGLAMMHLRPADVPEVVDRRWDGQNRPLIVKWWTHLSLYTSHVTGLFHLLNVAAAVFAAAVDAEGMVLLYQEGDIFRWVIL